MLSWAGLQYKRRQLNKRMVTYGQTNTQSRLSGRESVSGRWTVSASVCGVPAYFTWRESRPRHRTKILLQEIRMPVGGWFGRDSDCVSSVPVKR